MKYLVIRIAAIVISGFLTLACDGGRRPTDSQQPTTIAFRPAQSFTPGGSCEVTEGDSKGKKGKYDSDGWCCYSTSTQDICVECDKAGGGSRCKDAKLGSFGGSILTDHLVADAGRVIVTDGNYQIPDLGVFRCVTTVTTDTGSPAAASCSTLHIENIDDLKNSEDGTHRRIADAVTTAARDLAATPEQ